MKPFANFGQEQLAAIQYLVSDIDDTLTLDGVFPAHVYAALEQLRALDVKVMLITGRPAGWCDMIARFFPVDAIVGENGSFYFVRNKGAIKRYWLDSSIVRAKNLGRLTKMATQIVTEFPGTALAEDNPYRATDVAVDFAEDVKPLPLEVANAIQRRFTELGATAKVSSIHVNAWIGTYDKLSMFSIMLQREFGQTVDEVMTQTIYAGDSPNDAPMFRRFVNSLGVQSVKRYFMPTEDQPAYITKGDGADGFAELAQKLIQAKGTTK